jgi:AcrR family transcriptional regulator
MSYLFRPFYLVEIFFKKSDHFNKLVRVVVVYLRPKLTGLKLKERQREDKAELILSIAQKRFGLYGVEKTSMREIANDLRMSKASLYYYFPDKESLYKSVIAKEQAEFVRVLEEDLKNISAPDECLRKYALTRLSYFRKLLNISRIRLASLSELKPVIADSAKKFREEETKIVMQILEKGRQENLFKIDDTSRIATVFLDLLKGLRSAFLSEKDLMTMEEAEYDSLAEKVNDVVEIFIKGLMSK